MTRTRSKAVGEGFGFESIGVVVAMNIGFRTSRSPDFSHSDYGDFSIPIASDCPRRARFPLVMIDGKRVLGCGDPHTRGGCARNDTRLVSKE